MVQKPVVIFDSKTVVIEVASRVIALDAFDIDLEHLMEVNFHRNIFS
jgi:hypothetical protein